MTGDTFETYIQKSKEDWWLCTCGSYHKNFPYRCPLSTYKFKVKMVIDMVEKKCSHNSKLMFVDELEKELELWH